ncbi:hypothetical protein GGI22_006527, partial [Coemansia erecta]
YVRYRQAHRFVVDTAVRQAVYINVDVTVAMPCALLRVNVADASGDASNVRSSLRMSPVPWAPRSSSSSSSREGSELLRQGHRDIHVHDLIAKAGRRRQRDGAADSKLLHGDAAEMACRIAGSVRVNKVAGLLHITASGGGMGRLGGAFEPRRFLNFTHAIDALSFGPLYPGIANPLDSTLHIAPAQAASFKYFVSVVRTTYIAPAGSRLDTNQYVVNELRRIRDEETLREPGAGGLIPGIFFDYSFEPIAVEVRELRPPLLVFLARLCAALSGPFVTAGLVHQIVIGSLGPTAADPLLAHH